MYLVLFLIVMLIPMSAAFAVEFKTSYNYNLDDVSFQICMAEFNIYEKAASRHMGDPHKLMEWKQYTQCHDDAFLVVINTQHLCSNEVEKLEKMKSIFYSLSNYDRQHYEYNLVSAAEKAIDCHIKVYHEEMTKSPTIQIPEPKIVCGESTIDIDSICQLDKSTINPAQKSKSWFTWIIDLFNNIFTF